MVARPPTSLVAPMLALLILGMPGCGHDDPSRPAPPDTGPAASLDDSRPAGAELWADNCSRCHNIRPPQIFSDAQWETIVHHMRLRANLTGEEARLITEFLQASN